MTTANRTLPHAPPARKLHIELLALDLTSCGRCTRTAANLNDALASVASVLEEAGVDVRVEQHVVRSAEQAEHLRFVSSPTIRMNGRDIALDLRESGCGDCGELCGCDGGVNCRVWVWQGKDYQEAPKAMIVDAVLNAYAHLGESSAPTEAYRLPDNLRTFFSGRAAAGSGCCIPSKCGC